MPNRDVLNFITSGRMSSLRELSMVIDYKDWVRHLILTNPFKEPFYSNYFSTISYNDSLRSLISALSISHS